MSLPSDGMGRFLLSHLFLLLVAWADYRTGAEVQFGGLYLMTVAVAGWNLRPRVLVLYALVTVTLWMTVSWATGVHYSRDWLIYWSAGNRLASVALTAVAVSMVKTTLDRQRRLIRELGKTSLEADQLRALIPICRLCHQTRSDPAYGAKLAEYLAEAPDPGAVGDVCPDCLHARAEHLARIPLGAYFPPTTETAP